MDRSESGRIGGVLQLVFSIGVLIVAGLIFLNRQYLIDEVSVYNYKPSPDIAGIASSTGMTEHGIRYFYASHPELNDATSFNANCKSHGEQSIILGCYSGKRIYLFDITDRRLKGVEEVTAAHEMLHAAYDRLGEKERENLDRLLLDEASRIDNQRINDLIELYRKSDPDELQNEMHSIFGTEMEALSPELEKHYARYFEDRSRIVSYSRQYEAVFIEIEERQQQLTKELNALNEMITNRSSALNARILDLNRQIDEFNSRARSGGFASRADFNRERQQLIDTQKVLQQERVAIDQLIEDFNQKRDELIALNGEAKSLNRSLDSTPQDVPSIQE